MLNITIPNQIVDFKIGCNEYVIAPVYNRMLAQLYQNDLEILSHVGKINMFTDEARLDENIEVGFIKDLIAFGTWDDIQDIKAIEENGVLKLSIDMTQFTAGIERWNQTSGNEQIQPIDWTRLASAVKPLANIEATVIDDTLQFKLNLDSGKLNPATVKVKSTDIGGYLMDKIYPATSISQIGKPTSAAGLALWETGDVWLYPQIIYYQNRPQLYFGLGRHLVEDIDYKCRLISVVDTHTSGLEPGHGYEELYKPYILEEKSWRYPLKYLKEHFAPFSISQIQSNAVLIEEKLISNFGPEAERTISDHDTTDTKILSGTVKPGPKLQYRFKFDASAVDISPMQKKLTDIIQPKTDTPQIHCDSVYFNGDRKYQIYFNRDEFLGQADVIPEEKQAQVLSMVSTLAVDGMIPFGKNTPTEDVEAVGIRNTGVINTSTGFIAKPKNNSTIDRKNARGTNGFNMVVRQKILAMNSDKLYIRMESHGLPLTDINNNIDAMPLEVGLELSIHYRADGSIIRIETPDRIFAGQLQHEGIAISSKPIGEITCRFFDESGGEIENWECVISTVTTFFVKNGE